MMRVALLVLLIVNVLLFMAWRGSFGNLTGDATDPGRLARQINADQLKVMPAAK